MNTQRSDSLHASHETQKLLSAENQDTPNCVTVETISSDDGTVEIQVINVAVVEQDHQIEKIEECESMSDESDAIYVRKNGGPSMSTVGRLPTEPVEVKENLQNVQLLKLQPDGSYIVFDGQPCENTPGTVSFNAKPTSASNASGETSKNSVTANSEVPLVANGQVSREMFWESLSRMVKKELFERFDNASKTPEKNKETESSTSDQVYTHTEGHSVVAEVIAVPVSEEDEKHIMKSISAKDFNESSNKCKDLHHHSSSTFSSMPKIGLNFGMQSSPTPSGMRSSLNVHQDKYDQPGVVPPNQAAAASHAGMDDFRGSFSLPSSDIDPKTMAWCLVPPHSFSPALQNLPPNVNPVVPPTGAGKKTSKLHQMNVGYLAGGDMPHGVQIPVVHKMNTARSSEQLFQQSQKTLKQCGEMCKDHQHMQHNGDEPPSKVAHLIDFADLVFDKQEQATSVSKFEQQNKRQHNAKEKARRARIKESCDLLRNIVPGMTSRTDKATVFEYACEYIKFLKKDAVKGHEKDFLMKAIPVLEENEK